jgi:clan AA aspartic protease (TIGR02281 family)
MLRVVQDQITLIQRQQGDPELNQAVGARVAMRREEYMQAVLDAREVVEKAQENYALLAKDDEASQALARLNENSKTKFALGPSKTFLANVKQLEKYEATVLTEKVALRKEGGIFWVDVMFNGKVSESLAFDTGASSVVLPAQLAARIGLEPGKDAPTVRTQVADGSLIEAKQMVIPSVRLGKFTVKDVPCIVMPADRTNVPPLLGQTFLRHFLCHTNADAGTLVLTKIDAEDKADASAVKSKSAAKSTKGKRAASASGAPNPSDP